MLDKMGATQLIMSSKLLVIDFINASQEGRTEIAKAVKFSERYTFEFRADVFGFFNRADLMQPVPRSERLGCD